MAAPHPQRCRKRHPDAGGHAPLPATPETFGGEGTHPPLPDSASRPDPGPAEAGVDPTSASARPTRRPPSERWGDRGVQPRRSTLGVLLAHSTRGKNKKGDRPPLVSEA